MSNYLHGGRGGVVTGGAVLLVDGVVVGIGGVPVLFAVVGIGGIPVSGSSVGIGGTTGFAVVVTCTTLHFRTFFLMTFVVVVVVHFLQLFAQFTCM